MDQSGEVLLKSGLAENKVREGVTTAIAGEGGTPVPSAQIAACFAQLEKQGLSLNFGTYYMLSSGARGGFTRISPRNRFRRCAAGVAWLRCNT
jgi:N-acyl-D-amino-acid deacylase